MSATQRYAVWVWRDPRSQRSKSCQKWPILKFISSAGMHVVKRLTMVYDTQRQYQNFVRTDFWYSSSFGVTWPSKFRCWSPPAVLYGAYLYKLHYLCAADYIIHMIAWRCCRLLVLPPTGAENGQRFMAFMLEDKIGLIKLPLTGNPHLSSALIVHPQGVRVITYTVSKKKCTRFEMV